MYVSKVLKHYKDGSFRVIPISKRRKLPEEGSLIEIEELKPSADPEFYGLYWSMLNYISKYLETNNLDICTPEEIDMWHEKPAELHDKMKKRFLIERKAYKRRFKKTDRKTGKVTIIEKYDFKEKETSTRKLDNKLMSNYIHKIRAYYFECGVDFYEFDKKHDELRRLHGKSVFGEDLEDLPEYKK